jgi:hypothetical protein
MASPVQENPPTIVSMPDADSESSSPAVNGSSGAVDLDKPPSPTFSDGSEDGEPTAFSIEDDEEEEEDEGSDAKSSAASSLPSDRVPNNLKQDSTVKSESNEDVEDEVADESTRGADDVSVSTSKFQFRPVTETRPPLGDISPYLAQIDSSLRDKVVKLRRSMDALRSTNSSKPRSEEEEDNLKEDAADLVREILSAVCDKLDRGREEVVEPLAVSLCTVLSDQLEGRLLPENPTEENLEQSVSYPLFALFEFVSEMGKEDHKRQPVLNLMAEMYSSRSSIGVGKICLPSSTRQFIICS